MSLPYQPTLNFSPLSKNHGESSTLSAELVQLTQFSFKVSLDMATITAKHKIDTIVGGGADARVNSLVEGGPLKMGPEHWLANFLTKSLDKEEFDTSSGEWRLELHKVEYIFLNAFLWCDELKNRSMPWKCQPQRVSRFLAASSLRLTTWASSRMARS